MKKPRQERRGFYFALMCEADCREQHFARGEHLQGGVSDDEFRRFLQRG